MRPAHRPMQMMETSGGARSAKHIVKWYGKPGGINFLSAVMSLSYEWAGGPHGLLPLGAGGELSSVCRLDRVWGGHEGRADQAAMSCWARLLSSSALTSSTCVAIIHLFPAKSLMEATRSTTIPAGRCPRSTPRPSELQARQLGHPLLPCETCVPNDVEIGPAGSFLLVTGSNMSGKSTLLRAIGVNVVLAQAGERGLKRGADDAAGRAGHQHAASAIH